MMPFRAGRKRRKKKRKKARPSPGERSSERGRKAAEKDEGKQGKKRLWGNGWIDRHILNFYTSNNISDELRMNPENKVSV